MKSYVNHFLICQVYIDVTLTEIGVTLTERGVTLTERGVTLTAPGEWPFTLYRMSPVVQHAHFYTRLVVSEIHGTALPLFLVDSAPYVVNRGVCGLAVIDETHRECQPVSLTHCLDPPRRYASCYWDSRTLCGWRRVTASLGCLVKKLVPASVV